MNTMTRVVVVRKEAQLAPYLAGHPVGQGAGAFLCGYFLSGQAMSFLDDRGFRRASVPDREADAGDFIRQYNDLITRIASVNNSRFFWATDLASKNRFSSSLPDDLELLASVQRILNAKTYECLVLFWDDDVVISMIERLCIRHGIPCVVLGAGSPAAFLTRWGVCVRKTAGLFYHALRMGIRSFWARKMMVGALERLGQDQPYYVLKTFSYDHSFPGGNSYLDPFFGSLPEFLKGRKRLLILTNVLGDYRRSLAAMRDVKGYDILPVECFLHWRDIAAAVGDLLGGRIRVPRTLDFFGEDASGLVSARLRSGCCGVQLYHYLHFAATRNLLHRIKADTFTLTYENYPWERMCILALREFSPSTGIIGYQHTAVPLSHLNMFIGESQGVSEPLPDKILTNGAEACRVMTTFGRYPHGMLEVSAALRFAEPPPLAARRPADVQRILVPLEGSPAAISLVRYVVEELKSLNGIQVRVRPHPLLPWSEFERRFHLSLEGLSHLSVSAADLDADLNWADAVVYWSTSVAMTALTRGIPVIHFDLRYLLSYDSLRGCPFLKWQAGDTGELRVVLKQIRELPDDQWKTAAEGAREYIRRYFSPVSPPGLEKFLSAGK